ncbi:hypothetical protein PQ455_16990 [Sphingomonas naphthae]|uniref:Uncharacterized protein n=1 Tax=Sphingomonas naphthae TaxID=1813468 RepID=A0ABY7TJS9_9SPHN|nr:hypothetical protein [Sphingomonas naphthae]WCT73288.1 hypothetical protein PQ455_16990 [Sphingomonas naphthae]
MRSILGLILGALIAGAIIYLTVWTGQSHLSQPVADFGVSANEAASDPLAMIPFRIKLLLCLGFFAGAFIGALVADFVSGRGFIGWIIAGLVVLFALLFGVKIPHPTWMAVLCVGLPLLGGYVARKISNAPL